MALFKIQIFLKFLRGNLKNYEHEAVLILSDINMPKLSGFELKEKININENLNLKCIPYLFFTTTANQQHVVEPYSKSVQGFFVKPGTYSHLVEMIRKIIDYWKECRAPLYTR